MTLSDQQSQIEQAYNQIVDQFTQSSEASAETLRDIHHPMWQQLTTLFQNTPLEQTQIFLDQQFEKSETIFPLLSEGVTRRSKPKLAERFMKKLAQGAESQRERGAFVDWMACRLEAPFASFPQQKECLQKTLMQSGNDITLAWRRDMPESVGRPPDIVEFGYVFRKDCRAVMEIQIVEPIAAWVFDSNSRNKHWGETGCVTFKESRVLYEALKNAIIEAQPVQGVDATNVALYYQNVRAERGEQADLDLSELAKLQVLVNSRFDGQQ